MALVPLYLFSLASTFLPEVVNLGSLHFDPACDIIYSNTSCTPGYEVLNRHKTNQTEGVININGQIYPDLWHKFIKKGWLGEFAVILVQSDCVLFI